MANKVIKHSDLEVFQSDSEVIHFGILGMKWGVRKDRYKNVVRKYKIHGDGRIEIQPGQELQRLVTSEKSVRKHLSPMSSPLQKYAYMSFTPSDNAEYINIMSPDNKKQRMKRDNILTLEAKTDLISPSLSEAEKINVELAKGYAKELATLKKLPVDRKNFESLSEETQSWSILVERDPISNYSEFYRTSKALDKEIQLYFDKGYDPLEYPEKYPAYMYALTNREIAASDNYTSPYVDKFMTSVKSKGYNMLRDENDLGMMASPVIVLDPETNISIKLSEKLSKQTVKEARIYLEQAKVDWKSLGLSEYEVSDKIKKKSQ